jgi:hypothetical protein
MWHGEKYVQHSAASFIVPARLGKKVAKAGNWRRFVVQVQVIM